MGNRNQSPDIRLLTEVELEMMQILWSYGGGTVRDVLGALQQNRALAYTTVSTMLRILEQKGFVSSKKDGRGHFYRPLLEKPEYEIRSTTHLVQRVFDGRPTSLVRRMLEAGQFTPEELSELRALLNQKDV